jgi:hypothetical protein
MRLKQSPGLGLVVGLCGIAALLLSYFALPWISEGGEDVTFDDIRAAFHPDESSGSTPDPSVSVTLPGIGDAGTGEVGSGAPTTGPEGLPPLDTVTPPLPTIETPTVTSSYDSATEQLKEYTDWGWKLVLYMSIVAVVFATWLVPRDRAARLVTGTLTVPCLGWVNLFDREGASAPRVLSTLAGILVVLEVVGNAWHLFWDKPHSPDPAIGALLGVVGSIAVLAACIISTKREWVPEYA